MSHVVSHLKSATFSLATSKWFGKKLLNLYLSFHPSNDSRFLFLLFYKDEFCNRLFTLVAQRKGKTHKKSEQAVSCMPQARPQFKSAGTNPQRRKFFIDSPEVVQRLAATWLPVQHPSSPRLASHGTAIMSMMTTITYHLASDLWCAWEPYPKHVYRVTNLPVLFVLSLSAKC